MSDNNEYYAVKIKIQQKNFFAIWVSTENGDLFLKKDNHILFFPTSKELYKFCKITSKKIESETTFDFDSIDYNNCNIVIDLWNITSDLANTLNLFFVGDMDEMLVIYKKLLYGCNLPTLNSDNEKYIPKFSNTEINKLDKVVSNMKEIMRVAFHID